jgi:predicted dehydrogenase
MQGILVGLGGRGRHWLQVCRQSSAVDIVAYVEPIAERREHVKAEFHIPDEKWFESLDDALKATDAEFVLDVTPPAAREAIAQTALSHGLHVLAEKAMGVDWAMAKRIAQLAAESGRTYMVAQNYRFRPLPRTTRRLLDEGFLGPVNTVAVGFYRPWGRGAHYVKIPYALLIEMVVHHFDTLRYVLNRDPVRVWAQTWNAPWGWHAGDVGHNCFFEFEGGIKVTHHALGCSVGKMSSWDGGWRIEGEEGSLTWEDAALCYARSYPSDQETQQNIPLDNLPLTDTLAVLAEFVAAAGEGREPECSPQDNLKTLAMVFGAIESMEKQRAVEIAELMA